MRERANENDKRFDDIVIHGLLKISLTNATFTTSFCACVLLFLFIFCVSINRKFCDMTRICNMMIDVFDCVARYDNPPSPPPLLQLTQIFTFVRKLMMMSMKNVKQKLLSILKLKNSMFKPLNPNDTTLLNCRCRRWGEWDTDRKDPIIVSLINYTLKCYPSQRLYQHQSIKF